MKKLIAILMVLAMLFTLAACGGEEKKSGKKEDKSDPNLIEIGKYTALYTGYEIMKDSEGNDAIAIRLTYTNNSEEAEKFDWAFTYHAYQNDAELPFAVIFVSEDSYDVLSESTRTEVAPGESLEVTLTYTLSDLNSDVTVNFEELLGDAKDSLTIKLG
ncbi:MAG: DUF5067 domain-containing protein [Ruminococcaceae bacterium]|nr:DUF5067 domain-containing protein [Oscillospiraceae bacterium]